MPIKNKPGKINGHYKRKKRKGRTNGNAGDPFVPSKNGLKHRETSDHELMSAKGSKFAIIQQAKKTSFLEAYAKVATVSGAARAAGIDRNTHVNWMKEDADYRARFHDAEEEAADYVEQEIRRRAILGVDKPVFHDGKQVATIKEYSDTLAIFIMKALRPEKYRENAKIIVGGNGGDPIRLKAEHGIAGLDFDKFAVAFQAVMTGNRPDELSVAPIEVESTTKQ